MISPNLEVLRELSANMSRNSRTQAGVSPLSPPQLRRGMLGHMVDLANLVTLGGLAISFFACWSVLSGRPSIALALVAMAVVIDHVDGWIARRARGRNPAFKHFGAHLDCFSDYICKAIFPVLYLLTATDLQVMSIPVALIYLMAIAIRYSYEFVPDRALIGLSPDYMIAFLCLLQLAAPHIGSAFIPTLMASLVGFAALAVAPFHSPKLKGGIVIGFCLFLLVLAVALVVSDR